MERENNKKESAKKTKKIIAITIPIVLVCIVLVVVFTTVILTTVILPKQKYNDAMKLLESGDYEAAYTLLLEIGKSEEVTKNKYDRAMALIESGDYREAYALLDEIGNREAIEKNIYDRAMALIESGDYESAYDLLEGIGNSEAIAKNKYDRAMALIESGDYEEAYDLLEEIGNSEVIATNKYDRAMALIESGNYEAAYVLLQGLNYKDSADKLSLIRKKLLSEAEVGSYVPFGSYEQDGNTSNGKEDIEWLVLEVKDGKALVISKYALDCKPYNTSYTGVTWETCTLRKWLNNDFINSAFSAEEKSMISTTTVSADKNPYYDTDPGNATQDQVFLLSITEANKYFSNDSARQCKTTNYAVANGAVEHLGGAVWWLRSPGLSQGDAANVYDGGLVSYSGDSVFDDDDAVRPVLWINLDS